MLLLSPRRKLKPYKAWPGNEASCPLLHSLENRGLEVRPEIHLNEPPPVYQNSSFSVDDEQNHSSTPSLSTSLFLFFSLRLDPGFPGGAVVENPPAKAGDTGSIPSLGRSHMPRSSSARAPQLLSLCSRACEPQLLSPRAATTEACVPRAVLHNERSHRNEKPPHCNEEWPPLTATRESPCAATKTQHSQK